jgi:hypothetical protein
MIYVWSLPFTLESVSQMSKWLDDLQSLETKVKNRLPEIQEKVKQFHNTPIKAQEGRGYIAPTYSRPRH